MAPRKNQLEKIIIKANDDNLVQEFQSIIVKSTCHITSAERYFEQVPSWTLLKNKKYKENIKLLYNSFITKYRFKRHKPYTFSMNNVDVKLFKNGFYNQYVVFFVKNKEKTNNPNLIQFKIGAKFKKKFTPNVANHGKNKKRKRPKNYTDIVPLNNIFEHSVKERLKKCLKTQDSYISANAVFKTDLELTPKMFVSVDINKRADINNFLYEIMQINANNEHIMNHNIDLDNVQAFIVINRHKTQLYVTVSSNIDDSNDSGTFEFNNKRFTNANMLCKSNILSVKWLKFAKKQADYTPLGHIGSVANVPPDLQQNSPRQIIEKYEENIQNCNILEPMDEFMKKSYKILVELQLKSIEKCNQTYYNYFTNKKYCRTFHEMNYHQQMNNHYNCLVNLQNKAIYDSLKVSNHILQVNEYLEKSRKKSKRCQSQNILRDNKIILPPKSLSVQSLNIENTAKYFHSLKLKPEKFTHTINKSCSPLSVHEYDKKYTQTDISVNKNTIIDSGGKQIQICKRNIMLKLMDKKLKTDDDPEKLKMGYTSSEKLLDNNKNRELLQQIRNTLQMVKEKFDKNSVILKKASDLKNNFIVSTNIKNLMESDFERPNFVKSQELKGFSSTSSVESTKNAITMNLNNSLDLLKNLNEVTRNIKDNHQSAMSKLSEIDENIQLQKRLKLEKMNVTLTPIRNFIASNKLKVSNNAIRTQPSKAEDSRSKLHVEETQPFVKTRRTKKVSVKSDDPPTAKIRNPLTIETTNIVPCPPKIYRPVNTYASKDLPDAPKLSDLTLQDVAPLAPEYPRKDDLHPADVRKSYLYKLLNNSFSEMSLKPLIKCADANCASCVNITEDKNEDKNEEKNEEKKLKKDSKSKVREYVWEKMDWNTGVTVQNSHSFDFQKFMQDPNFKNNREVLAYPLFTDRDKKNKPESGKTTPFVAKRPLSQRNIQKSIQQSLIKNQEKYKFIRNTPQPPKPACPNTPKIISSGILPLKKNAKKSATNPPKKNHDMQKYIQLVEEKFLKTFSLPEKEKALAYNNLESEIKAMLTLLNSKKTNEQQQQVSNTTSQTQIQPKPKKCDLEISKKLPQKNGKKISNTPSNSNSVIVIKKPQSIFTPSREMVKKKIKNDSEPTACNIFNNLTSIVTKTNTNNKFPSNSILKKQSNTSVGSSVKKVRFSDEKLKSNTSISFTTDEEYSTMCEETVSDFSSDQELAKVHTDIAIWMQFKFYTQTVFPTMTCKSYQLVQCYQQYHMFDLVPENYELEIFSAKNIDTNSNFQLNERDSLSDFIESCEEIIQSTKFFDVKVNNSVNLLEFLNVMTNFSIENMFIRSYIYYKQNIMYLYTKHAQKKYRIITYYCQIMFYLSRSQLEVNKSVKQIQEIAKTLEQTVNETSNYTNTQYLTQEIHDTITELNTSNSEMYKIVNKLEESVEEIEKIHKNHEIHNIICQIKTTAQELPTEGSHQLQKFNFPRLNLEKHLSEPIFPSEFFQYHLTIPRILKCPSDLSDRNQLNILPYKSRKRYDDICQTVVFNLQIRGKQHRKSICKKRYNYPLKNRIQIRNIQMDTETGKKINLEHSHKALLIFFYIYLFSVLFLCMTINYKCQ